MQQQQAADGAARSGNLSSFQSQPPLAAAHLANSGLLNTRKASWPLHRICVRVCTCDLQLHGCQIRQPSSGNWLLSENSGQRRLCVHFTKVLTSCLHHSCTSCSFHWGCVLNEKAVSVSGTDGLLDPDNMDSRCLFSGFPSAI